MTKIKNNKLLLTMLIIYLSYCVLLQVLFRVETVVIVKYTLISLFVIGLPGLALFSALKVRLSFISGSLISYSIGYALIIIEYFGSEITGRKVSFMCMSFVVTIIAFLICVYQHKKKTSFYYNTNNSNVLIELFVLFIIGFLSIFLYSANYLGVNAIPVTKIHRDMVYWCNNSVALKLNFPPENLFMVNTDLKYHYFSSIPIAFISQISGIDIFSLSFPLYSLTKTIVLFSAVTLLLETINVRWPLRVIGYILLLFSTGVEQMVDVTFVYHLLYRPFGFDIGYAYGILYTSLLIKVLKQKKVNVIEFAVLMIFWIMCVGAKTPIALVLLFLSFLVYLYLLCKKSYFLSFLYGGCTLAIFTIVAVVCVGMFDVMSGASDTFTIIGHSLDQMSMLHRAENSYWITDFLYQISTLNMCLSLLIKVLLYNPLLVFGNIMIIFFCVYKYVKGTSDEDTDISLILAIVGILGVVLWLMYDAGGSSEMYFALASIIPFGINIIFFLKQAGYVIKKNYFIQCTLGVLLLIGVFNYCFFQWGGDCAVYLTKRGIDIIRGSFTSNDYYSQDVEKGIRREDVAALQWIRENTAEDAIVLSDKFFVLNNKFYYMYGMFCERQQYLEGTFMVEMANKEEIIAEICRRKSLIEGVYNSNDGCLEEIAQEGVDYIVQTKDLNKDINSKIVELVFQGDTINVYKIIDANIIE